MNGDVDLEKTAEQLALKRGRIKRSASCVARNVDFWSPTCICCGAMAMVAGAALFAHIPVIATTAALAVAGCVWFMVNSDRHPLELMAQYGVYGAVATGIAWPTSFIAGPAGAMVAGGVVLGAGLLGKFVNYMSGNDR